MLCGAHRLYTVEALAKIGVDAKIVCATTASQLPYSVGGELDPNCGYLRFGNLSTASSDVVWFVRAALWQTRSAGCPLCLRLGTAAPRAHTAVLLAACGGWTLSAGFPAAAPTPMAT